VYLSAELAGGADGLALIHPAVDVVVPGDGGPGEGFDPGGIVIALAARWEQRLGRRRHQAWSSVMRETGKEEAHAKAPRRQEAKES